MELYSSKIKKFVIFQEMKLSTPKIKKVITFSQKKLLYFGKWNFFKKTFRAKKIKKNHSEKISYTLGNGTF